MIYKISDSLGRGDVEKNKQIKYNKDIIETHIGSLDNIKLEIKNQKLKKQTNIIRSSR